MELKKLSYFQRKLLKMCSKKKVQKTDLSLKIRNAPKEERSTALSSLVEKGLLDFMKVTNEATGRPITFYYITDQGKEYLQEFDDWVEKT